MKLTIFRGLPLDAYCDARGAGLIRPVTPARGVADNGRSWGEYKTRAEMANGSLGCLGRTLDRTARKHAAQLFRAAVCCGAPVGVGERSPAGALPVGGFGFLGVRPLVQVAVTSQPKANSQVRLCRGAREHSQWGSDSSDCRAGKLELDARCWWRSVWQLLWVLAGWDAQASGAWRLRAWMRRWARLGGSQLGALDWTAGRWGMPFCISVPDETRLASCLSARLSCLPALSACHICPPALLWPISSSDLLVSQSIIQSVSDQAQASRCVGHLWASSPPVPPSHPRRASPGAQR